VAKARVLIVDDDDVVRTRLASLLSAAEFVVQSLPSAIGVTRVVVKERIDVVVVDIMMPSLSGDKLAALLRENPRLKDLGVVLVSGRPVEELQSLAQAVGADAVVTKSDVKTKLVAAVEYAARRRQRMDR
jgi:CheY-like chemotaxis protein